MCWNSVLENVFMWDHKVQSCIPIISVRIFLFQSLQMVLTATRKVILWSSFISKCLTVSFKVTEGFIPLFAALLLPVGRMRCQVVRISSQIRQWHATTRCNGRSIHARKLCMRLSEVHNWHHKFHVFKLQRFSTEGLGVWCEMFHVKFGYFVHFCICCHSLDFWRGHFKFLHGFTHLEKQRIASSLTTSTDYTVHQRWLKVNT